MSALTRGSGWSGRESSHAEEGSGARSARSTDRCDVRGEARSAHASAVPTIPPPTTHTSTTSSDSDEEADAKPRRVAAREEIPRKETRASAPARHVDGEGIVERQPRDATSEAPKPRTARDDYRTQPRACDADDVLTTTSFFDLHK